MLEHIIFDLDGTLTDPFLGITRSVQFALSHFGISVENLEALTCFIGPPLLDSFRQFYGFTEEQAEEAVVFYRKYFRETGIFENEVLEGIPELQSNLRAAGKKLYVATSKPQIFAEQILEHFSLRTYFQGVCGSNLDGSRCRKAEVIDDILNTLPPNASAVMVGDRMYDVAGAKEAGIPCIGVTYGYGGEEELRQAGADRIAATVQELEQCLLQESRDEQKEGESCS